MPRMIPRSIAAVPVRTLRISPRVSLLHRFRLAHFKTSPPRSFARRHFEGSPDVTSKVRPTPWFEISSRHMGFRFAVLTLGSYALMYYPAPRISARRPIGIRWITDLIRFQRMIHGGSPRKASGTPCRISNTQILPEESSEGLWTRTWMPPPGGSRK